MTYPQQPSEWSNPASWPGPESGGPQTGQPDPTAVLPSADPPAETTGYPAGYPIPGAGDPGAGIPGEQTGYPAGYPIQSAGLPVYPGQAVDYPDSAAGYPDGGQPATGMPTGYESPVPPPYGYAPPYGYVVAAPRPPTNGLSIAALVVSLVGAVGLCAYGLGGFIGAVGAILGHVSRRQIKRTGESGGGMALAGIVVGWIATAIFVIAIAVWVAVIIYAVNHDTTTTTT
jgi:hypothetical protein